MGKQRLRTEWRSQRAGATSDQIVGSGGFSDQPGDRLRNCAALWGRGCSGLEGSNQGEAAMPPASHPLFPPALFELGQIFTINRFWSFLFYLRVDILIADLRLNIHLSDHKPWRRSEGTTEAWNPAASSSWGREDLHPLKRFHPYSLIQPPHRSTKVPGTV